MTNQDIINIIYQAFNERDIDAVLKHLHPDVEWPNGWEGGYLFGQNAVRQYWARQWAEIDPIVTPRDITTVNENELVVTVRQLIKELTGAIITDEVVKHHYLFENGLVKKMIIAAYIGVE